MERRNFLKLISLAGLALPIGNSFKGASKVNPQQKQKLVIGVGSAGIGILETFKKHPNFYKTGCQVLAVGWNESSSRIDLLPAKERVLLGKRAFNTHSRADMREIKEILIHEEIPAVVNPVLPILSDASSLIVIAGIGGATGSLVGPSLIKASMEMGIPTLGVWIKPFTFENSRVDFFGWMVNHRILFRSSCFINDNSRIADRLGVNIFTLGNAYSFINKIVAEEQVMPSITKIEKLTLHCTYLG